MTIIAVLLAIIREDAGNGVAILVAILLSVFVEVSLQWRRRSEMTMVARCLFVGMISILFFLNFRAAVTVGFGNASGPWWVWYGYGWPFLWVECECDNHGNVVKLTYLDGGSLLTIFPLPSSQSLCFAACEIGAAVRQ